MKKRQIRLLVPERTASVLERAAAASHATLESFLEARFAELVSYLERRAQQEEDEEAESGQELPLGFRPTNPQPRAEEGR
ncbi:MAG TPA: hypothetical protein VNO17_04100 [Actinomycetota bacterium]|nr:hypothetical protein [Actinomycetota bacterium]